MPILEVRTLRKVYPSVRGNNDVVALKNIHFSVEAGEYVAIMGESGSGKTTLLNILATLDQPTAGEVLIDGENKSGWDQSTLAAYRRDHLGFVFQDFNLLDTFTVQDNIFCPWCSHRPPIVRWKTVSNRWRWNLVSRKF